MKLVNIAGCKILAGNSEFICPVYDLVIHIREVADIINIITPGPEIPVYDIKDHHTTGMTNVAGVIDSGSADIHADFARDKGHKLLFAAPKAVVYFNGHGFASVCFIFFCKYLLI
jgi:hypothetical protein